MGISQHVLLVAGALLGVLEVLEGQACGLMAGLSGVLMGAGTTSNTHLATPAHNPQVLSPDQGGRVVRPRMKWHLSVDDGPGARGGVQA